MSSDFVCVVDQERKTVTVPLDLLGDLLIVCSIVGTYKLGESMMLGLPVKESRNEGGRLVMHNELARQWCVAGGPDLLKPMVMAADKTGVARSVKLVDELLRDVPKEGGRQP